MKTILAPTVHLNGTNGDDLLAQVCVPMNNIRWALEALNSSGPHGRDYYLHGSEAFPRAVEEHKSRVLRLESVFKELEAIYANVLEQVEARQEKRPVQEATPEPGVTVVARTKPSERT